MWNERQRTQKIRFELERLKRELAEQDEELASMMRESFVTEAEVQEAGMELGEAIDDEVHPNARATRLDSSGAYLVRG